MKLTLLQFLQEKNKKSLGWIITFYWQHFLNFLYKKPKTEEKPLKHKPKVISTAYPTNDWTELSETERIKQIGEHYNNLKVPLQR